MVASERVRDDASLVTWIPQVVPFAAALTRAPGRQAWSREQARLMWADEADAPAVRAAHAQAAPVPERRQGERRAPPPRRAPGLGKAPSRVQRDDGPDFGPGVDWRLSRVNLDDVDAKGPPLRQQRETTAPAAASADIPARLAGRLVLPAADSTRRGAQPASPERTVQRVGGDLRVVLSNQTRSAAAAPAAPTAPARAASGRGHAVTKKAAAAPDKPPPKSAEKWRYKDPKGVVRDCTFKELIAWSAAGYFASGVPVQRASDGPAEWMTLGVALKAMAPPPAPKPQAATHHAPPPPDPAPEEVPGELSTMTCRL